MRASKAQWTQLIIGSMYTGEQENKMIMKGERETERN